MKISYNWLKQYADIKHEPTTLADILTACGLEVEALERTDSIPGGLEGIFIGHIVECEKHPDADKLSLTKVTLGNDQLLSIVCGAPNVAAGQKVLVAVEGTRLNTAKGELIIKKSKIRGEISEGMICAEDEIGLGDSHSGIILLPEDAPIGMSAKEYYEVETDHIFEIGLTPNRPDAASHIGVARDVIAVMNCSEGQVKYKLNIPSVDAFKPGNNDLYIPVEIDDKKACPRYSGITISGIKVKESPAWLKNRLNFIGLRPINNIVDITNFVLFETGQPLHAFDADKISGKKVIIKKLPDQTPFRTLDGVDRKLSGDDLMICNAEAGMCIAGVFGGEKSGVTGQTVNIFLESACFDPATIRKTSRNHGLKTDASFRFERGSDINMTIYALKRAALMFCEIAGGSISSELIDVYPESLSAHRFDFSCEKFYSLAGKRIEKSLIIVILESLGINILTNEGDILKLEIPANKVDVTREVDVAEEILRIYGYNNIETGTSIKSSLSLTPRPDPEKLRNNIADYVSNNGFYEIMTNSLSKSDYYDTNKDCFSPEKSVKIYNPLSKELDVMRQTLLFGGLEVILHNQNRRAGDLKLFEFGQVYRFDSEGASKTLEPYKQCEQLALFMTGRIYTENWNTSAEKVHFYFLKNYTETILNRLRIPGRNIELKAIESPTFLEAAQYSLNGKPIGEMGAISPLLLRQFDIKSEVFFAWLDWDSLLSHCKGNPIQLTDLPRFPEVRRDMALLIDDHITFGEIERIALKTEKQLLQRIGLFDIYKGEKVEPGKKSYAVNFIFQDVEKTLTDERVDEIMKKLLAAFTKELGASIR